MHTFHSLLSRGQLIFKHLAFCGLALWLGLGTNELSSTYATPPRPARSRKAAVRSKKSLRQRCGKLCRGRLNRMSARRINRLLQHLQRRFNHQERIKILGRMFLGTPYRFGPLGEGRRGRWDREPLFRLDKVDCLTYTETVMAMALSRSLRQAKRVMQRIRYKNGKIRYDARNHFTETQWLPENQRAGFVRLITQRIGSPYIKYRSRRLTSKTWARQGRWVRRLPRSSLPKRFHTPYVPLRHVMKIAHKLPPVTLVAEVFKEPGAITAISHVGMIIKTPKGLYFRHANLRVNVTELPLTRYIRKRMRYRSRRRPHKRIIGFAFATFTMPSPSRLK